VKHTAPTARPPRLVVRTLVATLLAMSVTLVTVFAVLWMDARARLAANVVQNLDSAHRTFIELERQRLHRALLRRTAVADDRELAGALAAYDQTSAEASDAQLQRELDRLAGRLGVDAVVLVDVGHRIVASGGPRRTAWRPGGPAHADEELRTRLDSDDVVQRPSALFRVTRVDVDADNTALSQLYLTEALDDGYAVRLSTFLRSPVTLVHDGELIATSLSAPMRGALMRRAGELQSSGPIELGGERWTSRRLNGGGAVDLFALEPTSLSAHRNTRAALPILAAAALGALLLGALVSLWLARAVARPIDRLSQQLRAMAEAQHFPGEVPRTGSSLELDTFTDTFNQLVASLKAAEAKTEQAYVGSIKALAAALDARDPYTAGHSDRVSALSVMIGRQLGLDAEQLNVLRLGALLHDIGKIGVPDAVLQKEGPHSQEEFDLIKLHPTLGAHILKQVPFLSPHIPIVELHHERPDGRGYPHGLLGHATPLLARIVHVADAFDAMTTARAYRPAQKVNHAIAELWRFTGSQFDAEVVEGFVAAWSAIPVSDGPADVATVLARATVVSFERHPRPVRTVAGE
jgi:putative nucleotidyltransferase with HDIG domain